MINIAFKSGRDLIASAIGDRLRIMLYAGGDAPGVVFGVQTLNLRLCGRARRPMADGRYRDTHQEHDHCSPMDIGAVHQQALNDNAHMGEASRWDTLYLYCHEVVGRREDLDLMRHGRQDAYDLVVRRGQHTQPDYQVRHVTAAQLRYVGPQYDHTTVPTLSMLTFIIQIPGGRPL